MVQNHFLNESGYKAYTEYLAIKRHFTSSYDYFKYNGAIKTSFDSFIARKDAYTFQRLSKRKDYSNFILSNVVENPKLWTGDLTDDSAEQTYLMWKKKTDSITSHIRSELNKMDNDLQSNFIVNKGHYPKIVDLYLQKIVSLETTTILMKMTNSRDYWKEKVLDNVLFPDIIKKLDKYHPFLIYNTEKIKKVVKDHFF
jgi:cyclophilin family peptidyl-prolyl cis-trans isomerase